MKNATLKAALLTISLSYSIAFNSIATTHVRISKSSLQAVAKGAKKNESTEPEVKIMSQSLPFLERPQFLTGAYAGDVGFDPLNFARGDGELFSYREAEIKHSRLAMLAAAGWPLSELLDKKIANTMHLTPLLDAQDRVPSPLNGGLGQVSPIYWIMCLGFTAVIDVYGTIEAGKKNTGYSPGDFGFDPLGLYPEEVEGQKRMKLAEIKHGRLAMIAVTGFAVQEYVSNMGVIDETPFFFSPISL